MDAAVATKSGGGAGATGVAAAAQAGMNGGETRSRFQRICVYCGSAKGRKPSYQDAAVELGKELVRHAAPPPSPSPQKNPAFTVKKFQSFRGGESPPPGLVPDENPAPFCCCHLVCLAPLDCASAAGRLRVLLLLRRQLRPWRPPRVPSLGDHAPALCAAHAWDAVNLCSAARHRGSRKAPRVFAVLGGGLVVERSSSSQTIMKWMVLGCRAR
jgi:hypothetical protein